MPARLYNNSAKTSALTLFFIYWISFYINGRRHLTRRLMHTSSLKNQGFNNCYQSGKLLFLFALAGVLSISCLSLLDVCVDPHSFLIFVSVP